MWRCWVGGLPFNGSTQTLHPLPLSPTGYMVYPSADASPLPPWPRSCLSHHENAEGGGKGSELRRRIINHEKTFLPGAERLRLWAVRSTLNPGLLTRAETDFIWKGEVFDSQINKKGRWEMETTLLNYYENKLKLFQKHFFKMCQPIRVVLFTREINVLRRRERHSKQDIGSLINFLSWGILAV